MESVGSHESCLATTDGNHGQEKSFEMGEIRLPMHAKLYGFFLDFLNQDISQHPNAESTQGSFAFPIELAFLPLVSGSHALNMTCRPVNIVIDPCL